DMAKFEVCGHKFADLSEHGFGVALMNDCKYGYSCRGGVMRLTLLRSAKVCLHASSHSFRYALYPHSGTFHESDVVRAAYQFNAGLASVAHPATAPKPARPPPTPTPGSSSSAPTVAPGFFTLAGRGSGHVVIDTVKLAEDARPVTATPAGEPVADVVVRLYEAYGGRGELQLNIPPPIVLSTLNIFPYVFSTAPAVRVLRASQASMLEELREDLPVTEDGKSVTLSVGAFEVLTVRLLLASGRG
ncbi:Glycoside hydrolase, 38 vacuolar alpha mannosidase, partial [Cladochytrium tenue]